MKVVIEKFCFTVVIGEQALHLSSSRIGGIATLELSFLLAYL